MLMNSSPVFNRYQQFASSPAPVSYFFFKRVNKSSRTKGNGRGKENRSAIARGWGGGILQRLWGDTESDEHVLSFDWGLICQNTSKCTLKRMDSTLFELYPNKPDINETNKQTKISKGSWRNPLHRGQRWFSVSMLTMYSHLRSMKRISRVLGRCPQSQIKPGLCPPQFLFEKPGRLACVQ